MIATAAPRERGFILVGVVMFMLALTILGLSLFSLSSYEAQFFYGSLAREQALQRSESGLELVKALLTSTPARLENAQSAVGQYGITRAIAYQWRSANLSDTTSRGLVNWDSSVVVVVTARERGESRTLQARFTPIPPRNPYRDLVTCAGRPVANTANGTTPTVELYGPVWQTITSAADTVWTPYAKWLSGRPFISGVPPTPAADAYVDARLPSASAPTAWDSVRCNLTFRNTGSTPRWFVSPRSPTSGSGRPEYNQFGFFTDALTTISVSGTCVWVIPAGVCFRQRVIVQPEPGRSGTLVIVAKRNGLAPGYTNTGIWFQTGLDLLDPTNTKLFLVSQGDIALSSLRNASSRDMRALSIVAGGNVEFMPPPSGSTWKLMYDASMDAVADGLVASGAVPATSGGSSAVFAYTGASWKETRLP